MKKLIALLLFLTTITTLSAFDSKPQCWQGFYLNGQVGAGWHKQNAQFTNPNYFNTLGSTLVGSKFNFQPKGVLGGGALGYNAQIGCWVLGIEAGALGTNLKESRPSPFFPEIDTFKARLNWLAFTKLRLGYAYDRFLPFFSGGWAGGYIDMHFNDSPSNVTAHTRRWANGWTVGTGCDYKLTQCFSLGLAYDYINLRYSHKKADCSSCGTGIGFGTPSITNHAYTQALTVRFNISL